MLQHSTCGWAVDESPLHSRTIIPGGGIQLLGADPSTIDNGLRRGPGDDGDQLQRWRRSIHYQADRGRSRGISGGISGHEAGSKGTGARRQYGPQTRAVGERPRHISCSIQLGNTQARSALGDWGWGSPGNSRNLWSSTGREYSKSSDVNWCPRSNPNSSSNIGGQWCPSVNCGTTSH